MRARHFLAILSISFVIAPPARAEDYYSCFPETYAVVPLQVTVLTDSAAAGSVEIPGIGFSQAFSIPANSLNVFAIPASAIVSGSNIITGKMIHVISDVPVDVVAFAGDMASQDAFAVKEASFLGTDYVVASYPTLSGYASEFAVVAPQGPTTLSITPSSLNDGGMPPGIPFQVILNAGDVYQLQASVDGSDLTGTIISADKNVAVFSGNELATVPEATGYADYLMTQLSPTNAWGTEFVVPKSDLHNQDRVRITALGNGTLVSTSDGANPTLNAGETLEHVFTDPIAISASGPVQVVHYFESQTTDTVSDADPSMAAVPPRTAWKSDYRIYVDPAFANFGTLAIVAPCASAGAITVDGTPIPGGQFSAITGSDACAVLDSVSADAHVIAGPDSFAVLVYGYGFDVSLAYYSPGAGTGPPPPPAPVVAPVITAVDDVPNDQGRQVRIVWNRATPDSAGSPTPITDYAIFRRHDPNLAPSMLFPKAAASSDWDYVTSVPAFAELDYATVVPTLADSTITSGLYQSVFFVRAATATPSVYFDSLPDTGYSVDNLEPSAPLNLSVAHATGSGNQLSWDPATEPDFMQFRIYRGPSPDFPAVSGNLVAAVTDPQWTDPGSDGWDVYYKVTTVDFSGNESAPAGEEVVIGVGPDDRGIRTRLYGNSPNPFRPSTTIRFDLARETPVVLSIYDIHGRQVRKLVSRTLPGGRHAVVWNGRDDSGMRVTGGIYFYRMEALGVTGTGRLVMLD